MADYSLLCSVDSDWLPGEGSAGVSDSAWSGWLGDSVAVFGLAWVVEFGAGEMYAGV